MRRIHSLLLIVFLLIPLMLSSNPAYGMDTGQMETIVANARSAVDTAMAQLQSAIRTGDVKTVQLAQDALDLAIGNYAVASESLAKVQEAGGAVSDSVMLGCNDVANGVINVCSLIARNNLPDAQSSYNTASTKYDSLPPSANPGEIPGGLADIQAEILSASSESATIIAGGGTDSGTADSLGTNNASPI